MKNVIVKIEAKTSQVFLNKKTLGINGENLQGDIIFEFTDEFVNGVAWLEVQMPNGEKGYLECTKQDETYALPILSSLLTEVGNIEMQLRITENGNEIPVFKSNKFYLEVKDAINATTTIPEEYPSWIDIANTKLNQVDNVDIDLITENENTKVMITRKDGTTKETIVSDGSAGKIDDVLVDGKSVVVNRIANINLSDLDNVLRDILEVIQSGISTSMIIEEIEQLIVSYLENKTVEEVEA